MKKSLKGRSISISKPLISKKEISDIVKILESGTWAMGSEVERFEKSFAEYIGTKFAVAVGNGTQALHLAMLALEIGDEDEVITTPFSSIASTNCVLYVGATPVFADINEEDFCIDPLEVEKHITKKTKAIVVVHLYGQTATMEKIIKIAKKHGLYLIEDACQAHGAEYKGKKAGNLGDIGCFSFYPTKNMSTLEGGMLTTNNKDIYEKLKLLRNHGQNKRYYHNELGYNFRMLNISGVMGSVQLRNLNKWNEKRRKNATYLTKHLSQIPGIGCPKELENRKHVFHQYTIKVGSPFKLSRDRLIEYLSAKGIGSGVYYPVLITDQKSMKGKFKSGKLSVSKKLISEVMSLPVHPSLSRDDLDYIINCIKEV